MANRNNHYEAAFEAWLQRFQISYMAVDEARRLALGGRTLKNLDFIVSRNASPTGPTTWLIDVKGRQFPTAGKQFWRNWTTKDEVESLARWEELFGPTAQATLVFAYNVVGAVAPLPAEELFEFRQRLYGFVGVRLDHYASLARTLSARWDTVTVQAENFRSIARSARELLGLPNFNQPARDCSGQDGIF